jgi:serine/threonine protein kinase
VVIPEAKRQDFFFKVQAACRHFERAGICHLDIRLPNIFFREISTTSSASASASSEIDIKIIDFDYSSKLNIPLDPTLKQCIMRNNTIIFPTNILLACKEWHDFMLKKLLTELELDESILNSGLTIP